VRTGLHLISNQKKLDSIPDIDTQWVKALKKCRAHVITRLKRRTLFGAHTEERHGMDPVEYYVSFAYQAILEGNWEWKDGRTLGQQLVRIADNRIGKEVEKYKTEQNDQISMAGENIDDFFYSEDKPPDEPSLLQEAVFIKKISVIEEAIIGDVNLEAFWECIKDGMKREEIASFIEKSPKQIDKIREKLINKIKSSPHFEL
jgi:hypothetical protein